MQFRHSGLQRRLASGALLATAFLAADLALAAPLTWTVENVVFDDGQTLSGSFTYDADTNSYTGISLVNSGSATFASLNFDTVVAAVSGPSFGGFTSGAPADGAVVLGIDFNGLLTNAGGTVPLAGFPNSALRLCANANCTQIQGGTSPVTFIVSGQVSVVPLPATAWLLVTGLGGLAFRARRSVST